MTRIGWAALVAAILASAYSIAEAIAAPITGHPVIDQESGPNPALTIVGALLISTFTLGVAVLWEQAERIDAGSSFRRWVRRLLQAALAALALISGIGIVAERIAPDGLVSTMDGAGSIPFLSMFVLGATLGFSLIRRSQLRAAAYCLASVAALIPLTVLTGILLPGWAHAAYAETALYIGIALLARTPQPDRSAGPAPQPTVAGLTA